jgi:hypothetical protein
MNFLVTAIGGIDARGKFTRVLVPQDTLASHPHADDRQMAVLVPLDRG